MDTSPPPRSIQRLLLFAVLMSVSTSCFSAPPPAQNGSAPTDASPSASPSSLPSSPPPTSPAPTPQPKEFDRKWQAFTDAIRANLNQESAANFKKVQDAAQELIKVPNLADDLQLYLNESIIKYPSLPPDPDYRSFNTVLAKVWLPTQCDQNVNSCFERANKDATVNGIIAALNQKYKPQSPPSPRPSPSPASSPTPTTSTSPSPGDASSSAENSPQPSMSGFLGLIGGFILFLVCGGLGVWVLSKNNQVRKLLLAHDQARPWNEESNRIPNASSKTALKSRVKNPRDEENEKLQTALKYRVQNPRDFEENEKLREEVRTLTHDCNELVKQVQLLQEDLQNVKSQQTQSYPETQLSQRWIRIQGTNPGNQGIPLSPASSLGGYPDSTPFSPASSLGGYPDSTESRYGQNAGILPSGSSQSPMVPSSNPAPGTNSHQEQLKRLFSQGIPVEDANMGQRRAGYEDYPVLARSSQGRSMLAVYPNPNTNELCLLPNPNTATYQYLESYFNLEAGSPPNGSLYLIQAAQVVPHGDGWRLAVKGIIHFTVLTADQTVTAIPTITQTSAPVTSAPPPATENSTQTDLQKLQADLQQLSTGLQSLKQQIRQQQSRIDSLAQSKQSDFSKLDEKLNLIAQRFEEKFKQLEAKIQTLEETDYKPQSPSPIILSEHNPAMVEILNRYRKNGKDFFESGEYVTIANPVNFPKVLTLSPKSKTNFALIRTENQGYIVPKPDYSAYSKLQSCFELVGSQEYGDTCLEEPARVIPVGSDWHIVQKGKVSFKSIPED